MSIFWLSRDTWPRQHYTVTCCFPECTAEQHSRSVVGNAMMHEIIARTFWRLLILARWRCVVGDHGMQWWCPAHAPQRRTGDPGVIFWWSLYWKACYTPRQGTSLSA